jgi:hypothetical protein
MELLESDSARPRQARYQAALRPDKQRFHSSLIASLLLHLECFPLEPGPIPLAMSSGSQARPRIQQDARFASP